MKENPPRPAPPEALPILGRGKHRRPARGACFMEYTSVLAGERFSDSPRCVDAELASVLRSANDRLSDEERPAMVPLLGRAIGLVAPASDHVVGPAGRWLRPFRSRQRRRDREHPGHAGTAELRQAVAELFLSATEPTSALPAPARSGRQTRVSHLFWDRMQEPGPRLAREKYVERLVSRLDLLHRCYEDAMAALGLPLATTTPSMVDQ